MRWRFHVEQIENDTWRNFYFIITHLPLPGNLARAIFNFFNRTLVVQEEKKRKKQAKRRNNLLQDYGSTIIFQILRILSVLVASTRTHLEDVPHSHLRGPRTSLERAPLPPFEASDFLVIDATPPFVFLPGARFPFLRPSRGLRAVTRPSALPLLLYVSSGAALFDSPLEYVHAERCRENQVTGRGVARLTREIEIIEQSRRLDDIYSHEFREEVVARLENLHFPIDCRDHRRDSLLPRYSLSRYYSSSSFSLRWISLFILLIIAFFNSSSVLSRRLFGDRDRDNKISSRMRHFFYESRVLLSVFAYSDDIELFFMYFVTTELWSNLSNSWRNISKFLSLSMMELGEM